MTRKPLIAFLIWIWCIAAVHAQGGYPPSTDKYVNDFANVLSDAQAGEMRSCFADLRTRLGVEAVAVTIRSMGGYATGQSAIEPFATGLFNQWGIGDKSLNNGALLLVAIDDHKVRIELGKGYGRSLDSQAQAIIDRELLPKFRSGQFGEGITSAARSLAAMLEAAANRTAPGTKGQEAVTTRTTTATDAAAAPVVEAPFPSEASIPAQARAAGRAPHTPPTVMPPPAVPARPAQAVPTSWPPQAGQPSTVLYYSSHGSFGSTGVDGVFAGVLPLVLVFFLVAGAIVVVLTLSRAMRKRHCPSCRCEMTLLDEVSDDMYLDSGQKLEEVLGSIDWAVFQCPRCGTHSIEPRRSWFSSYSDCPQCGRRTLQSSRETICPATTLSAGSQRVTRDCRNCHHHDEDIVILPQVEERRSSFSSSSASDFSSSSSVSSSSSSSTDSNFSGGSSSGGGASGSW